MCCDTEGGVHGVGAEVSPQGAVPAPRRPRQLLHQHSAVPLEHARVLLEVFPTEYRVEDFSTKAPYFL